MLFMAYLCDHILLESGGGTWGTTLYTVKGVGSGSRDVDAWPLTSPRGWRRFSSLHSFDP